MSSVSGQPAGEQPPPAKRKRAALVMLSSASAHAATGSASSASGVVAAAGAVVGTAAPETEAKLGAAKAAAAPTATSGPSKLEDEEESLPLSSKVIVHAGLGLQGRDSSAEIKGLAADPSGEWEVWVKASAGDSSTKPQDESQPQKNRKNQSLAATSQDLSRERLTLQGVKMGKPVWDLELINGLTRLVVARGVFAAASGSELQVFSLTSATLVLPPMMLGARIIALEVSTEGKWLLAACRDASLMVYNLEEARSVLRTSLRGIAAPDDIAWLKPRPSNGQPVLRLKKSSSEPPSHPHTAKRSKSLARGTLLSFDPETQTWQDLLLSSATMRWQSRSDDSAAAQQLSTPNPRQGEWKVLRSDLEALGLPESDLRDLELVRGRDNDCAGQSLGVETLPASPAF